MKSTHHKNLIIATAIAGIGTLVLGMIISIIMPLKADLSEGFRTPIIAFEFAKTEADLSFWRVMRHDGDFG